MKLLFHTIIIFLFRYMYSQNSRAFNGCGKTNLYEEPINQNDCKDSSEICCYVFLKKDENNTKKFCFPAPKKMEKDDIEKEIKEYTGYNVENLECFDFSEKIRYIPRNILLLGLILI